ncbi:MAG: copper chaperone [Sphingobacteriales bacterium]|uniref:heavy-metal-associated domain-containing protein n=1 Tax=Hydrotalea flava TaxID=714549 RepID=UPI00082AA3A8|nr:heavy-metal-associated domain-containing protein [Hydrotalea flava]RTL48001.1 MAG: copper chaperone [Sphingobacteriales bacterium]
MKYIFILLGTITTIGIIGMCGCGGSCAAKAIHTNTQQVMLHTQDDIKTVTFKITGMSCAGCSNHIHSELAKTSGIISDVIQYPGNTCIIKYDASKISEKAIIAVIDKAGYKAVVMKDKSKTNTADN